MKTNDIYQKTIDYYDDDFNSGFAARTATTEEVRPFYDAILPLLKPGDKILDFGCGTGRDSLFFESAGFDVIAWDASDTMCQMAADSGVKNVVKKTFMELDAECEFDLVWAYASLLHCATKDLPQIFNLVYMSLKQYGKFFVCFKYGEFEGERNGRLFNDFTEEKLYKLLKDCNNFIPHKIWTTDDVRTKQNRSGKWLNAILIKGETE